MICKSWNRSSAVEGQVPLLIDPLRFTLPSFRSQPGKRATWKQLRAVHRTQKFSTRSFHTKNLHCENKFLFHKTSLSSQYQLPSTSSWFVYLFISFVGNTLSIITKCDFRWDFCFLLRYTELTYIANILKLIQGESTFIFFRRGKEM